MRSRRSLADLVKLLLVATFVSEAAFSYDFCGREVFRKFRPAWHHKALVTPPCSCPFASPTAKSAARPMTRHLIGSFHSPSPCESQWSCV